MEVIDTNVMSNIKRKYKKTTDDLRQLIVDRMNSGLSATVVGDMFSVNPNTIHHIYKKYQKTGQTSKGRRGHRERKLSDQQKEQICDWLDIDCTHTIAELKIKLMAKYSNLGEISSSTIRRAVKEFHYSFKRVTSVPEGRNTPEVINQRFNYAIKYNQMMVDKSKLYFIDETGVQIWSRANYGYSPIGTKAHKRKKQIRSRNYSIATAMNENSLFYYQIQDKPYNGNDFSEFLTQLFQYLVNENITGAYLVMDNVRFHHTEEVTNLIGAHGHNAVFLPAYSPFLNPIEEMFNQWKGFIKRSQPKSEEELYEAVHNTSDKISAENCRNYIKHMESYLIHCLHKEVIES